MPKDTKYCDLEGRPHNCDVCSYCNSLVLCLTFGVQFTLRGGPGRGFFFSLITISKQILEYIPESWNSSSAPEKRLKSFSGGRSCFSFYMFFNIYIWSMRYDNKNIIICFGYKENILYFCHSLTKKMYYMKKVTFTLVLLFEALSSAPPTIHIVIYGVDE